LMQCNWRWLASRSFFSLSSISFSCLLSSVIAGGFFFLARRRTRGGMVELHSLAIDLALSILSLLSFRLFSFYYPFDFLSLLVSVYSHSITITVLAVNSYLLETRRYFCE
jgi:hypothetical protein